MDIPVLKYVDVLIGLALVMLLMATAALSISQALLNMTSSRARHLVTGLRQLIRQVHPALLEPHAGAIAHQVLLHPLVRQPRSPVSAVFDWLMRKLHIRRSALRVVPGAVILREELALCLLEWASEDGAWSFVPDPPDPKNAPKAETVAADKSAAAVRRAAIISALRLRGIEDPSATLRAVRLQALANEREHPEQAAALWRGQALLQCAPSEFLAGLYQAFDTTMARATAAFASEAQVWVSAVALVLVLGLQLDAFDLIRRLSVDEHYRQTLVAEAQRIQAEGRPPSQQVATGASCDTKSGPELEQCRINEALNLLHSPTLDIWPSKWTLGYVPRKLPGMVFAWLLISLGAPFWYDLIKNLFKLRSILAQKDDADRTQRNAAAPAPATTATTGVGSAAGVGGQTGSPSTVSAPLAGGQDPNLADEMGDLSATGAQG